MSGPHPKYRAFIAAFGVIAFWLGVTTRVGLLQLCEADFRKAANSQRTSSREIPALPGRILDRVGRPLAISVRVPSVYVDPSRIEHPAEFAAAIGEVLKIDETALVEELQKHSSQKFRWLRRRIDADLLAKIEELEIPSGCWGVRYELKRVYPQGTVAAHLLGLRGFDGEARGGIEEQFAEKMTGTPGRRRVVTDARGRPLSMLEDISLPPRHGADAVLTLDAKLSTVVGRHLDAAVERYRPKWAVALVIDPRGGELLAVESRPCYDPNNPVAIADAGFHHAFRATFEPGSTVKPLVVAAALAAGVVNEQTVIDCGPGKARVGGRPMHDAAALGMQPLDQVLARSSNIGAARVAEKLGAERLYDAYRDFGFGQPVPASLNAPTAGVLRPTKDWSGYSMGALAMGHELSVSPLQLLTAYASLSQGRRVVPRLVKESGELIEHAPRSIDARISQWVLGTALVGAVQTGTVKSLQIPGVDVFGKTGTAQKFDPERGEYRTDRATCVVVGGAPANAPTRIVVVVVDDPTENPPFSGGRVAGPIAREILQDALRFEEADSASQSVKAVQ